MDNQEMLEQAAKTIVDRSWWGNDAYFDGLFSSWNPLESDADAFRLAVDLGMMIVPGDTEIVVSDGAISSVKHPIGDDKHAATRLAIVRAAAEIGKTEPPEGE